MRTQSSWSCAIERRTNVVGILGPSRYQYAHGPLPFPIPRQRRVRQERYSHDKYSSLAAHSSVFCPTSLIFSHRGVPLAKGTETSRHSRVHLVSGAVE